MSDTPRTDASIVGKELHSDFSPVELVDADFARQLERELAAAKQRADEAEEKEAERWAQRLDWLHREYGADASGCDSGDALDCVEVEIRQALTTAEEHARQAHEQLSEVVSDIKDPSVNVPWMRCSPDLPSYIKGLEDAADVKQDEDGITMGNVRDLREAARKP